jgi:hypothetical protein
MTETIGVIEGVEITRIDNVYGEIVHFVADFDSDNDGSGGNPEHDPCHQNDTTLHAPDGRALNPYEVPFVAIPPLICQRTRGKVLGSECLLTNKSNGKRTLCVVGDISPHHKIGEASPKASKDVGAHATAFSGDERHVFDYEIRVGKPALINGVQYGLKSYGG